MEIQKSFAVAKKDIREVFSSISIFGPMFGIPLAFSALLPIFSLYIAINEAPSIALAINLSGVSQALPFFKNIAFMTYFSINVLGPIFMTMPIVTSGVIAADSFAGEKERRTAESLLLSPVTKSELLLGKILATFIPAVLMTFAAFAIYGAIVNILSYAYFGAYILPTLSWLTMLGAVPLLALAPISLVVLISSRVKGIKEAQQLTSLLVLPLLILPFSSLLGLANLTVVFLLELIASLVIIDLILFYVSVATFKREALI